MKAVVLAAGKGTRMRELTQEIPKPMLRVQGRPILEHILEGLKSAGITENVTMADRSKLKLDLTFSKWDVPVSIGAPPADQVKPKS